MIYPREDQSSQAIADHYDDLDYWYRKIWGEHVHHGLWRTGNESTQQAVEALSHHLAQELDLQKADTVCDIGCGYGGTARILASGYGVRVTGYTLSQAQYDFANALSTRPNDPVYHLRNWFDNDLEAGSMDAAISIESSEHMEDKPAFFREIHRVLKPGGRIGVYAWLAVAAPRPWQINQLLEPICREGRLPSMGDESDYRTWMTDAGFEDITFEDLSTNVRRTWLLIIARMLRRLTWDKQAWGHLFKGSNRIFAKTVLRILAAYYTGTMRYGLFTAKKPTT